MKDWIENFLGDKICWLSFLSTIQNFCKFRALGIRNWDYFLLNGTTFGLPYRQLLSAFGRAKGKRVQSYPNSSANKIRQIAQLKFGFFHNFLVTLFTFWLYNVLCSSRESRKIYKLCRFLRSVQPKRTQNGEWFSVLFPFKIVSQFKPEFKEYKSYSRQLLV